MCFVLLICGVLLVFVILQHISITADKGQSKTYKDTIQVFNETINRLQNSYSDLMTKKDQLQEKFNVMSDELNKAYHKAENNLSKNYKDTIQVFNETMNRLQDSCSNLRTNKDQLQDKFNIMSDELKKAYQKAFQLSSGWFFMSSVSKNWSESRQYCKDRGADLVIIKTEVKQLVTRSNRKGTLACPLCTPLDAVTIHTGSGTRRRII
ncbi:C-type lectin domain family 4 member M [Labeo rohita]|uniref:C-type lectin domain family 4 member M n=1 Tax=Labeo rohita TaxID=84645 RepID=A0ABQ8MVR4_LABRO|nr:C-type lectin domain family 4 member M [Labeo rohita]